MKQYYILATIQDSYDVRVEDYISAIYDSMEQARTKLHDLGTKLLEIYEGEEFDYDESPTEVSIANFTRNSFASYKICVL